MAAILFASFWQYNLSYLKMSVSIGRNYFKWNHGVYKYPNIHIVHLVTNAGHYHDTFLLFKVGWGDVRHYLSQCWHRSMSLGHIDLSSSITKPLSWTRKHKIPYKVMAFYKLLIHLVYFPLSKLIIRFRTGDRHAFPQDPIKGATFVLLLTMLPSRSIIEQRKMTLFSC